MGIIGEVEELESEGYGGLVVAGGRVVLTLERNIPRRMQLWLPRNKAVWSISIICLFVRLEEVEA